MTFKKFLRRNLNAADGTGEINEITMGFLTANTESNIEELSDQLSGNRKLKDHPHHKPKDLTDEAISGIKAIIKLRREIGK